MSSDATQVTNWAKNIAFGATRLVEPTSIEELQAVVAGARRVRALGTGHSFNRIADTEGDLVSVRRLPQIIDIQGARQSVRVSAGTRYGELGATLEAAGLALTNTGSLPHISVAGSCATGTHGSGITNPILGRGVRALTMVTADGDLVTVDRARGGEDFDGYVLSLGRLGIVTELVLDVVPSYEIAQTVIESVPDAALASDLVEVLTSAYSVSIFTPWLPDRSQIWVKARTDSTATQADPSLWGGRPARDQLHPVPGMPAHFATAQLGVPGRWIDRLPHFRLDFTPSSGEELQSEYLAPLEHASAAWRALSEVNDVLRPALLIGEIRCVAGDSMWLSPTQGRDCVAFHFTWSQDLDVVRPAVRAIETALAPYDARPHWGKVFGTSDAELAERYPRLPEVRDLVARHDPAGKLGNDLVDGWLGLSS